MRSSIERSALVVFLTVIGLLAAMGRPAFAAGLVSPADAAEARVALAERLESLADKSLRTAGMSEAGFRETAGLLDAAQRVNPQDPRYPRLLASADLQLQDVDGQIAAWIAYRKIVPDDREAQQELIDLYASRMQTADAKLAYLRGLIDKTQIADEVRAHIAAECVPLLLDRSKDEAIEMVARAKKLYALPEVLRLEYELVGKDASPLEQVKGLLALIKANPAQPQRAAELARLLATKGLAEASLQWYAISIGLDNRMASSPSHGLAIEYVAELYIAGESQAAGSVVSRLLQVQPDDADLWFMKLTLERAGNEQVALSQSLGLAKDGFVRRLATVNAQILGNPTTQPAIVEAPNPAAAVAALSAQDQSENRSAFIWTLNNLAWFEIYYDQQPEAATPWINALKSIAPADDVNLTRLKGWQALIAGQTDDARAILSKISDRDPLAALGIIRIDTAARQDAGSSPDLAALKARVLSQNLTGLVAAVLREGIVEINAAGHPGATQPSTAPASASAPTTEPTAAVATAPTTEPDAALATAPTTAPGTEPSAEVTTAPTTGPTTRDADSAAILSELDKFPKGWLDVIDQASHFYSLRGEPVRTLIRYGDPLYARVTLKNNGNYDLFIGNEGLIQPHLMFDAQLHGIVTEPFPGVDYDRIANNTVLRPNATITQVVRFDRGDFGDAMRQSPNGSIIVTGSVITNPLPVSGAVSVGPGGSGMQFTKNYVRMPMDLRSATTQKKVDDELADGSPMEKLRALDLLAASITALEKEMDQSVRVSAGNFIQRVAKSRGDSVPQISLWAQYLMASLPGVEGQITTIHEMIASKDWQTRMLGLAALREQHGQVQQQEAAAIAESDPDPTVKQFAMAILEALNHPATQPTSKPSADTTAPSGLATEPAGPALPPTDTK